MRYFFTILLSLTVLGAFAQRTSYFRRQFVDAEYYLLYEDYKDALPLYLELHAAFPNNANISYRVGQCYMGIPNEKGKAIPFFEKATKGITNSYKEGFFTETKAPIEAYFYLGQAFRISQEFENAVNAFEKYRGLIADNPDGQENKQKVKRELEAIEYAKEQIKNPVNISFTPVSNAVNTQFSEMNPVVSANNQTLAYTTIQQFYHAIMVSTKRADVWTHPVHLNAQLFADGTIYTVGISADGNTLILARNDNDTYNLYTTTRDTVKNTWSMLARLPKEINTRNWENYACFSPTGDTLYYSSNQPGGFGGFDLYMSTKTPDGWSQGINLGAEINTPDDEIAPSVSHNGKKLFFSSNGHTTMGGFDLFVSVLEQRHWAKPKNLGSPINTTDDDIFFSPLGDGTKGYLSRPLSQNQGNSDIYFISIDSLP